MCCYALINNANKAHKWEARHKNRYQKLLDSKQDLQKSVLFYRTFMGFKAQSKVWLDSPEFKEKYIDTKHPYPALLNPDSIDYESIPAKLAWDMNLPLPPHYHLIYFNNGASASLHILNFFALCGVELNPYWIGVSSVDYRQKYELDYNLLLKNKHAPCNVIAVYMDYESNKKFFALLNKSVPLLYVARDPISRIKSACNHDAGFDITARMKTLQLSRTDFANLFPKTKYWGGLPVPKVQTGLLDSTLYPKICFDSFLAQMPHLGQKYIFSFESFAPNCAFETFKQIAKIFNLNMPNDERLFNTRAEKARFGLGILPVEFRHNEIKVHITADSSVRNDKIIELTKSILGQKHYFINDSEIIIYCSSNDAKLLESSDDFALIKAYLRDYIQALKSNVKATLQSLVNEKQILEYLRSDKKERKKLKQMLDSELGFLKANHPDIVDSWQYYKEFEKMCEKLDSS